MKTIIAAFILLTSTNAMSYGNFQSPLDYSNNNYYQQQQAEALRQMNRQIQEQQYQQAQQQNMQQYYNSINQNRYGVGSQYSPRGYGW